MNAFLDGRVMFTAFEDWSDAGKVSTTALKMLTELYQAEPVKEIDADQYLDYHVYRPQYVTESENRRIQWPTPTIYRRTQNSKISSGTAKELYFLLSPEPNIRWKQFAREVIDYAKQESIDGIVFMGSMLTDIPHTRPFPVFLSSEEPKVRYEVGIPKPSYEGPASIAAAIQERASEAGISSMSLWAPIPHYTQGFPCPKALLALLNQTENLLSAAFPYQITLAEEVKKWENRVTQAAQSDPRLGEYIKQLEKLQDGMTLSASSSGQLVRSLERYLHAALPAKEEFPAIAQLPELPE